MRTVLATIPHNEQRYDTIGDYIHDGEIVTIVISDMQNPDYELLVGIHELIEEYLTHKKGVKEEDITAFDMGYEENRTNDSEPGDSPLAPYHEEHKLATKVEKYCAKILGVKWKDYDTFTRSFNG